MNIFMGMTILWIFFGGHHKIGLVLGVISMILGHLGPHAGLRSAVGNVSGYRCVSDCRSRGREFDPGPVPYFRGD